MISLVLASLLVPTPQSETDQAIVSAESFPIAIAGLAAYLLLTMWIGSVSRLYGVASTVLHVVLLTYGIYASLSHWSVLR